MTSLKHKTRENTHPTVLLTFAGYLPDLPREAGSRLKIYLLRGGGGLLPSPVLKT